MEDKLGKTIRILRQAKGMRIADVATEASVSVPFLSLVENGARQPSLDVLGRIAVALGVPVSVLASAGSPDAHFAPRGRDSYKLANAVANLIEMEAKLRRLMETKGSSRGSKKSSSE